MSKMTDYLLEVQELVVEAMEYGAKSNAAVFAYVYMMNKNVSRETVDQIIADLVG